MSHTEGNEAIIAREPVATARGLSWVPVLSGNAIRHRLVREPGWRWLVGEYGLAGRLTLPQLNFLFHGGSLTEGTRAEDTRRIADFQKLFPLGRLLGGCLPDQVLAGSLKVWRGTLVCEQNRTYLASVLPGLLPDAPLRPAESFVEGWQYVRSGAKQSVSDLAATASDNGDGGGDALMIYAGQAVVRGATFVHGFTLPHCSELELGSLVWSLRRWAAAGGTIGGMAAKGHGRLRLSIVEPEDVDMAAAEAAYLAHARAAREEAVTWLHGVFAPRPEPTDAQTAGRGRGRGRRAVAPAEQAPTQAPPENTLAFGEDSADG